ncbi:GFA family protein [Sneathiella sp.]|uniref:GFA family protein n=1 Tax=Sneathiella sp. TaxID=1964365 RepID=UPI0035627DB1
MSEVHATGGCLCGGVRYEIYQRLRPIVVCHCKQCRRTSGYLLGFTGCEPENLKFVSEDELVWYASSKDGRRGFCHKCGSSLFWKRESGGTVDVAAGSLDEPTGLRTAEHIFTDFAGDYYEITDGLRQHAEERNQDEIPGPD